MENFINFSAYDIKHNQLPFDFKAETLEDGNVTRIKIKAKSTSKEPVYPALFKVFEWDSDEKSLHVFKPGFNKPSDNALFYTPEVGKPLAPCNTMKSDCLEYFDNTSLLISTMCH